MIRSVCERLKKALKRRILGYDGSGSKPEIAASQAGSADELVQNLCVIEAYGLKPTQEEANCCENKTCKLGIRCLNSLSQLFDGAATVKNCKQVDDLPATGNFVGLKNLGNTCYMTVALQVLFHDSNFRNALCRAAARCQNMPLLKAVTDLFDAMEVDPARADKCYKQLLKTLNREGNPEGDPVEFTMSTLTGYGQKTPEEFHVFQQITERTFMMEQNIVLSCMSCEYSTCRQEQLLFLSAKVPKKESSLVDLLKLELLPEILYFECPHCPGKQASLQKGLMTLPETVFIQVEKAIYNRSSGRLERLNTPVELPSTIDFNGLMVEAFKRPDAINYSLQAIVNHHGQRSEGGHYTVHIRDQGTKQWKTLNDSRVTDFDQVQAGDLPFKLKSNTACWVVYKADPTRPSEPEMPIVEEQLVQVKSAESSFLSGELVPLEWLKEFCKRPKTKNPINNNDFICQHGKANPYSANEMRAISKTSADFLYTSHGGGPRLELPFCLCQVCSHIKNVEQDFSRYQNIIKDQAKDKSFWIERNLSWRWPKVALDFITTEKDNESVEVPTKRSKRDEPVLTNSGVLCPHGLLPPTKLKSRVIPAEAWRLVKKHLPEVKEVEDCKFRVCNACKPVGEIEELWMLTPTMTSAAASSAKSSLFKGLESSSPLVSASGNVSHKNLAAAITPKSSIKLLKIRPDANTSGSNLTTDRNQLAQSSTPDRAATTKFKDILPGGTPTSSTPKIGGKSTDKDNTENKLSDELNSTLADVRTVRKLALEGSQVTLNANDPMCLSEISDVGYEEGHGEEQAPHPAGIVLRRAGYYTIPSLSELAKLYKKTGKCEVPNFLIGRLNYGNIFFDEPIDVAGMNLDENVHIKHREVVVYPNDEKKPSLGQGLNRKAQVTLDRIYPTNEQTKAPIRDVDTIVNMDFDTTLRKACIKMRASFIEYLPNNGSWVFKVDHFSKYGLLDETDYDVMVVSETLRALPQAQVPVASKPPVVQAAQQPAVPPKPANPLPSRPHQHQATVTPKTFPALLPDKMDKNCASDSALFQGKSAKTSWNITGKLLVMCDWGCDQLVTVTCPYLASDIRKELLVEHLSVQLRLTEFNPEDGLYTTREGGDLLISHSDLVKSKSPSSAKERMARQVLLLYHHTLWGDLNSGSTSTPAFESHLRRQAVCEWLQTVICKEEASSSTQDTLLECVNTCQEASDHFLSLLVASSGLAVYPKQMVLRQVHDWVSIQQMNEDHLRASLLCGADQPLLTQEDGVTLNALQGLPWLSALAANTWCVLANGFEVE